MAEPPDVVAINLTRGIVILEDGQTLPITNMFGQCGEDVTAEEEVASVVAGPASNGDWYSVRTDDFEAVATH